MNFEREACINVELVQLISPLLDRCMAREQLLPLIRSGALKVKSESARLGSTWTITKFRWTSSVEKRQEEEEEEEEEEDEARSLNYRFASHQTAVIIEDQGNLTWPRVVACIRNYFVTVLRSLPRMSLAKRMLSPSNWSFNPLWARVTLKSSTNTSIYRFIEWFNFFPQGCTFCYVTSSWWPVTFLVIDCQL